jgi:hypothetical protein
MNDEIISEVRFIKDDIAAKFNYDLRALFEDIKRGEAKLLAKGIQLIPPPINSISSSALQRNRFAHRVISSK